VVPEPNAVADAAARSPLREGPSFSELADADELRFRDEIEDYPDPLVNVPAFIEGKELPAKLAFALREAGLRPRGTVVELGAGTCWLSATLAREPGVERVVAVEFSHRRLVDLAPVAIAHLDAPAERIERVHADFHNTGLEPGSADFVITDSAFHHSHDPEGLARIAFDLLAPGGTFVLFREPSLSLLRRTRDHGEEGLHGGFEHEYFPRGYLRLLRSAGFAASRHRAAAGFRRPRLRALLRPPLSWLNGIAYSEFTYVGVKPGA